MSDRLPRLPRLASGGLVPPATIRLDKVWLSPDYCGCCGQPAGVGGDALWCAPCREHIGKAGHPWDRTFFALTGAECPFKIQTDSGTREGDA